MRHAVVTNSTRGYVNTSTTTISAVPETGGAEVLTKTKAIKIYKLNALILWATP